MEKMTVSIIIPCGNKKCDIEALLIEISSQEVFFDAELIRIDGVSPPSRARNEGVKKAKGEVLVFIDSDIRLADAMFLKNLVTPLTGDKNIGMTCASLKLPPWSSNFQMLYASQVPHSESPVPDKPIDVFVASSACSAICAEVFRSAGGFDENIIRGEDSVLSSRVLDMGLRLVLVPDTVCYHPVPEGLLRLIAVEFRNGKGVAFTDILYPELNIDVHPESIARFSPRKSPGERIRRFFSSWIKAIAGFKVILVLSKFFYACGYLCGVIRYCGVRRKK